MAGEHGDAARFISFASSGRIFGFGGSNRFSGTYGQHDEHLTVSPLATTKMLGKVCGAMVDHTLLLLLDEAGEDLKPLIHRDPE